VAQEEYFVQFESEFDIFVDFIILNQNDNVKHFFRHTLMETAT